MNRTTWVALLWAASAAWAQNQGAKALFYNPISGNATAADPRVRRPTATTTPGTPVSKPKPSPGEPTGVASAGLRYWIELQTLSGEIRPVPASHIFKSGDRIRLHVQSNIPGKLTILQKQDGGPAGLLFPPASANGRVEAFQDNVIPSMKASFRFDNKPGKIALIMELEGDPPVLLASSTPPAAPAPPNDFEQMERRMRAEMEAAKRKGGKSLVFEEDSDPKEGSFACQPVEAGKRPKLIAALTLTHQ